MRNTINIAAASINTIPLDVEKNVQLILDSYHEGVANGADIVLTPELGVTGYGLEDMFYVSSIMNKMPEIIKNITLSLDENKYLAVGFPYLLEGGQLYNVVALLTKDKILGIVPKQNLARSGIHYEPRWFTPWVPKSVIEVDFASEKVKFGDIVFVIDNVRIGFEICEDSWVANRPGHSLYERECDIILNPSASHFALSKEREREMFITEGSRTFGVIYVYTNLLGCEAGRAIYDGEMLIASGGKIVATSKRLGFRENYVINANCDLRINRNGRVLASTPQKAQLAFTDGVLFTNLSFDKENETTPLSCEVNLKLENPLREAVKAVCLGLWDWMRKTHTRGYALSLSGGADSALCLACVFYSQLEALGALGVNEYLKVLEESRIKIDFSMEKFDLDPIGYFKTHIMPKIILTLYQGSDYSGDVTFNAAKGLAEEVGAWHHSWSISNLVKEYIRLSDSITPESPLSWEKDDLALQNIQARVRAPGIWLLANKYNKLLLATSNLSEASVGYCTMDGDTSGVLSPIGGIGKSLVLKINRYLMEEGLTLDNDLEVFKEPTIKILAMEAIVAQAPTAELRPVEQTDEKDLMPYPLLDEIRIISQNNHFTPKEVFIELNRGEFGKIYSAQFILDALRRYYRLYCRNQWKRERIACSFHIERDSADPKTFRRFPVLSSALKWELKELNDYAKVLGLN